MRARQVAMAGLVVVAVPLLAVLAPSVASAAEAGSSCATASKSSFGVVAPTGPQQRGEGKGTKAVDTGSGTGSDEIVATGCFTRIDGNRARVTLEWRAIGHLYEGIFWYQLVDCATGDIADARSKTLEYWEGTPDDVTSGSARAEFPIEPGHTYKPLVRGAGKFDRSVMARGLPGIGLLGHFGQYYNPEVDAGMSNDPNANKFYGAGACA